MPKHLGNMTLRVDVVQSDNLGEVSMESEHALWVNQPFRGSVFDYGKGEETSINLDLTQKIFPIKPVCSCSLFVGMREI